LSCYLDERDSNRSLTLRAAELPSGTDATIAEVLRAVRLKLFRRRIVRGTELRLIEVGRCGRIVAHINAASAAYPQLGALSTLHPSSMTEFFTYFA